MGELRFLTSVLDRGEWSAPRPGRFTPEETAVGVHWIAGWFDPNARLDVMGNSTERKLSRLFIADASQPGLFVFPGKM
jgi:hypothetical protein